MWQTHKLGEICVFENGDRGKNYPSKKHQCEKGIPFINAGDLSKDGNILDHGMAYITEERYDLLGAGKIEIGDVLFCLRGSLGKCALNTSFKKGAIASSLVILRPKRKFILPEFLLLYLKSPLIEKLIKNTASGTAQPNLSAKVVSEYELKIPSVEEQQRIIAKLDAAFDEIDRLVALKNSEYKNSTKIFDNYLSKIFQDKSSTWEKESLKNICLKIGSGATPKGGKQSYKNEGISLIRSMNVRDLFFKEKDLAKIDDEQAEKLSNVEVKVNDVLLNITGASVARCCLVKNSLLPARINQHVSIIRLKEKTVIPKFLMYGLVSKPYKDELLDVGESNGATRQAITKKQIEEFQFKYPKDLDLQKSIIDKLDKIHSLCLRREEIYNNEIRNYEALKLSFLSRELKSETK